MRTEPTPTPPLPAVAFLAFLLPAGTVREAVLGDMEELYLEQLRSSGSKRSAALWYFRQIPPLGARYLIRRLTRRRFYRNMGRPPEEPANDPSGGKMFYTIITDVRFALRSFTRSPGFTVTTVGVLGLGVGAISLMFSTFNAVVLRPLPYDEPDRLTWIWANNDQVTQNSISYLDYVDYRDQTDAFESLGAYMLFGDNRILSGGDETELVTAYYVSSDLFPTLRVSPQLGRSFLPEEEQTGQDNVIVLSLGFWERHFGSNPGVVGTAITLDGTPAEVVGVMPAGFDFPAGAEVWFPLQRSAGYASGRGNNNFLAVGRLLDGATMEQAQAQITAVAANIAAAYPESKEGWSASIVSLHEMFFGNARDTILLLIGIITLVPLVACANVASLVMARAVTRKTELAARLALGASRGRIIRQLLTENLVVALGGGALGLFLAWGGGELLKAFAPEALPRLDSIGVDIRVVAFTLLASFVMVPIFGIVPAFRGTDMRISETLKSGGGRGAGDGRSGVRNMLVVAQVSLSLMLMLAAGLIWRSAANLQTIDPGFTATNLLSIRMEIPSYRYETFESQQQAWAEIRRTLGAIAGVLEIGGADRIPVSGRGPWNEVWASERPPASAADKEGATRRFTSEGFFSTMGIPLRGGRTFTESEVVNGDNVTVINEALANQFFPGENPVGKTLVLDWSPEINLEIVGVVGNVRELGLGPEPPPLFYLPASGGTTMRLLLRTAADPLGVVGSVREAIRGFDRDIPIWEVRTMEERMADSLFQPRFRAALVGIFSLIALVLSATGLYGILAFFVRQRSHEISVRMALGAGARNVIELVVGRGMKLVGIGVFIGTAGALAGGGFIEDLLFEVSPRDPATFAAIGLCLVLVALAASAIPAFRAGRLNPAEVMKAE